MVEIKQLVNLARLGVIGAVSFLAVINLGLSAHLIYFTMSLSRLGGYYSANALTLATSILTMLTLPVMAFISMTRNGAFPTFIAVEVGWFWFLWIMWLASAAEATGLGVYGSGGVISEWRASQAFSFLNWLMLMFYTTTLFILAIVSHVKGSGNVWTSSVKEFDFDAAINKTSVPAVGTVPQQGFTAPQFEQKTGQSVQYPPQQPQMGQPMNQQQPQYNGYAGQPVNAPHVAQV